MLSDLALTNSQYFCIDKMEKVAWTLQTSPGTSERKMWQSWDFIRLEKKKCPKNVICKSPEFVSFGPIWPTLGTHLTSLTLTWKWLGCGTVAGMSGLAPNGTNLGLFKNSFSNAGLLSLHELKSDVKNSRISSIWALIWHLYVALLTGELIGRVNLSTDLLTSVTRVTSTL